MRIKHVFNINVKGNDFVYSNGPPGMHRIELISDIISCQLGGAKLSFWYFYSGPRAQVGNLS